MKSASLPLLGWRDFISLLGSAVAWPFAARAQQPEQMRRIGVLMNMAADDPQGQASIAAFHQGLQEWGWMLGRNARIDDTVTASAQQPGKVIRIGFIGASLNSSAMAAQYQAFLTELQQLGFSEGLHT